MEQEKNESTDVSLVEADSKKDCQDTYHIFDYMEKHHGFFVTCCSAVFAITVALINLIVYTYQRTALQRLNIDIRTIDFPFKGQLFYCAVTTLFYCIVLFFFFHLIDYVIMQYCTERGKVKFLRYFSKQNSKLHTSNKKELKKLKKKCNSTKDADTSEQLQDIEEAVTFNEKFSKECNKAIRRLNWHITLDMLKGLLFSAFLFLPIIFIHQTITGKISWTIIISWAVCFLTITISQWIKIKIDNKYLSKKKILERISREKNSDNREREKMIADIFNTTEELTRIKTLKELFSDKNIKSLASIFLISLVSLYFLYLIFGMTEIDIKKDYMIYTDDEQYVVVFQEQNRYIMEKAIIDGDILTIDTTKQRIINSDDIVLDKQIFSKVILSKEQLTSQTESIPNIV